MVLHNLRKLRPFEGNKIALLSTPILHHHPLIRLNQLPPLKFQILILGRSHQVLIETYRPIRTHSSGEKPRALGLWDNCVFTACFRRTSY